MGQNRVGANKYGRGVLGAIDMALAQVGAQQLLAAEHVQRQIAVAIVVAVKEAALLLAVQGVGPLLIEYPPVQDSLLRIGQAMDAAHVAGIPIVVVQEDGFGKGTQGWKIHDVVASRATDHHIHKTLPRAFTNTGLAAWLAERDINTLSVVGYVTHKCNASTLFEARPLGLSAEFLSGATGAVPYANGKGCATAEEIHRVFSVVFESNFAAVVSTETWVAAVQVGKTLPRDDVMASYSRAKEM